MSNEGKWKGGHTIDEFGRRNIASGSGSPSQMASARRAKEKAKAKNNPVKIFTKEEIKALGYEVK